MQLGIRVGIGYDSAVKKTCPKCDTEKDVSEFTVNRARKDGLQPYCRDCMKIARREHYQNNVSAHMARNKRQKEELRQYVAEVKSKGSCADCGIRYPGEPWLFDFDHLPGFEKDNIVSRLTAHGSKSKIDAEIAKCEQVCLICHRRRTAARAGWTNRMP